MPSVESWLVRAARRRPEHPALDGVPYAELLGRADRVAARLAGAGVRAGNEVGVALPPGEAFVVVLHALLRLGAVAVPVDPALEGPERERRLARAVATLDAPGGGAPGPGPAGPGSPAASGPTVEDAAVLTVGATSAPLGDHPPDAGARLQPGHDLDATAIVVHTSGTSGAAKPIALTYGNWLWSALGSSATLGCPPGERWLCAMPLHHVGGLSILVRSAVAATTAVVHPRWDTDRVLAALRGADPGPDGVPVAPPTVASLVPTTLRRLLDAGLDATGAPALRWFLLGGAAIPGGMLHEAAERGLPVAPTYGMSETCSQIATLGAPLFCTRVDLAPDGEVLVAGPTVAPGALADDGRLHTGDLGAWDESGRLVLVGRKSDTIITGGENVLPLEVERVLEDDPSVAEAAVFGRPDREWGERVCALLVPAAGADVDLEAVRARAAGRLAAHQRPRDLELAEALPRTPSGKLLRRALR